MNPIEAQPESSSSAQRRRLGAQLTALAHGSLDAVITMTPAQAHALFKDIEAYVAEHKSVITKAVRPVPSASKLKEIGSKIKALQAWRAKGSAARHQDRMAYVIASFAGMDANRAYEILEALTQRSMAWEAAPVPPLPPASMGPVGLRERLGLHGEVNLRDVARIIAQQCTNNDVRLIIRDVWGDQPPRLDWLWPDDSNALGRYIADAGIEYERVCLDLVTLLLVSRLHEMGNTDARSILGMMRPQDAWDALAVRFGRRDLVGRLLNYDAGVVLARLWEQAVPDPETDSLVGLVGVKSYAARGAANTRLLRLFIDDAFSLRHMLGLTSSTTLREALAQFRELPQLDATRLLRTLLPGAAYAVRDAIGRDVVLELIKFAHLEGCLPDARRLVRDGVDLGHTAAGVPLEDQALRDLLESAGFPSLEGLNEEQVCDAVRRVPQSLARVINEVMKSRWDFFKLEQVVGIGYGRGWTPLKEVAARAPTLQELATEALSAGSAWRAVCARVGFTHLSNRNDPDARLAVAVESIATEVPDSLILASRLDALTRNPQTQRAAQTRIAWRALALQVGRPDLATRTGDAAARELAASALRYTEGDIRPLVHRAALTDLQRRRSVRAVARSRDKGKQPELSR